MATAIPHRNPVAGTSNMVTSERIATDHFVQLYEEDSALIASLSEYIRDGLTAGDVCIVIATREHAFDLEAALGSRGLDMSAMRLTGHYVYHEAATTLAAILRDGVPNRERFEAVIGTIIKSAARITLNKIRAFGEMVGLLTADGKHDEAIVLEELWNDYKAKEPFELYCAYKLSLFTGENNESSLKNVCRTHSHVIPAESYSQLPPGRGQLDEVAILQQRSKTLEREITHRRAIETQLQKLLQERENLLEREQSARLHAERANRLKDEFIATVSHELRTPLSAVLTWAELLKEEALDAETVRHGIETIDRNARHQAGLIDDLLDVSRIVTGNLKLLLERVNFSEIVKNVLESFQISAQAKGVALVTPERAPAIVFGDPKRLQQIVWNLLSNAIKFTPKGGKIEVEISLHPADAQNNACVVLAVSDTGEGIPIDFLPAVFDRFRQAKESKHGGLGLGLAIVRHLVELHHGSVTAYSSGPGKGATFTVCLPIAEETE